MSETYTSCSSVEPRTRNEERQRRTKNEERRTKNEERRTKNEEPFSPTSQLSWPRALRRPWRSRPDPAARRDVVLLRRGRAPHRCARQHLSGRRPGSAA